MRIIHNKTTTIIGVVGCLSLAVNAFGAGGTPMQVNPSVSSRPGAPSTSQVGRSGTKEMIVRLHNSCYGINLRGTSNPLSPNAEITAKLNLLSQKDKDSAPVPVNLMVKYPGMMADKEGINVEQDHPPDPGQFSGPDGMTVKMFGNTVEMRVPMPVDQVIEPNGDVIGGGIWPVSLSSYSFDQKVDCSIGGATYGHSGWSAQIATYPCGQYMGHDGPLSMTFEGVTVASDNSSVDISVKFPGQTGWCGGYYSPLMLFFDAARPKFIGSSPFKLSAASLTYWVEAGAPGYFLAMDRNGNGKIDSKEELFGDQDSDTNGFDPLREFDSNKDGAISAKDKLFNKLVLWQDKNGDGISQDDEMEALSKRVSKISLKYRRVLSSYGAHAEARQKSDFWFKDGGKTKKGMVEDIYFMPVNPGMVKK